MPLNLTIKRASEIVGSQRALAAMLGEHEAHISNMKAGTRPCTIKKRAALARIAQEDPTIAILEGLADSLDKADPDELAAREIIMRFLDQEPLSKSKPKARK